jgi:hypothetical protein
MILGRTNALSTSQDSPCYVWCQRDIANSGGGSAGNSVTIGITFAVSSAFPNGFPTPNYAAHVTPSQGCLTSVQAKTQLGFSVVLTPSPATSTLVAGSFDVCVLG